ncbi:MAG: DNA-3-methyladenine glycosylase I [Bacilli bacterium]
MEKQRCEWVGSSLNEQEYHDLIWGKACYDSLALFRMLCLEGMQAGLSWLTILNKLEGLDKAFSSFNPYLLSEYTKEDVDNLLTNPQIIRHRLKIESMINNAKIYVTLFKEEEFSQYIWSFVDNKQILNYPDKQSDVMSTSIEAIALSKSLKEKGFKFIGPSIAYAFMQATGLVDDHLTSCFIKEKV